MLCEPSTPFDLRFRLFGFPVTINGMFWVGALMMSGGTLGDFGPKGLLAWVLALLVAIFVHELGHAFVARAFGSNVLHVKLIMLGGFCQYDREPRSRWRRIAISLAGPGAGFLLWGLLYVINERLHWTDGVRDGHPFALFIAFSLSVNLILNLINLTPVLPLDGGRVSLELCEAANVPNPGIVARWIGIVIAVPITICGILILTGNPPRLLIEILPYWLVPGCGLMTVWMGVLAAQNIIELRQLQAEQRGNRNWYGRDVEDSWR